MNIKKNPSYEDFFKGYLEIGRYIERVGKTNVLHISMFGDMFFNDQLVCVADRSTWTYVLSKNCPKWRVLYSMIHEQNHKGSVWSVKLEDESPNVLLNALINTKHRATTPKYSYPKMAE